MYTYIYIYIYIYASVQPCSYFSPTTCWVFCHDFVHPELFKPLTTLLTTLILHPAPSFLISYIWKWGAAKLNHSEALHATKFPWHV